MMYGLNGKILRVNLSTHKVSTEELEEAVAKDFIGGRGLAVRYLTAEIDPLVDPLSQDNKLIFATGPATGTQALAGSRFEVVAKAPLTETIGGANSSDKWGPELKFAGWDMIIFEGKAKEPAYLWIADDKVEIRDANDFWGQNTNQTQEDIRAETDPKAKVACIGPAGENQVLYACIINDAGRAAGRGGLGAVMGAKNLKAVAVKGTKRVPVADENRLKDLVKRIWKQVPESKKSPLHNYGTAYVVWHMNEMGGFPTRNFQEGMFEGAEKIDADAVNNTVLKKRAFCYRCPVGCSPISQVNDANYKGEGAGPEYEGLYSLGSCCGVDNLAAIMKSYFICNELGMDVISAGVTVACAMEMHERGILTEEDVGMPLRFGDGRALVEMVRKAGLREGFGEILAEGSKRLAERYGHPELSMSVKGLEQAGYDPRSGQAMGLAYATSTRGACHMRSQTENYDPGGMLFPEIGVSKPVDRFATQGKAALVINLENDKTSIDSMGICAFLSGYKIGLQGVVDQLEAITGIKYGIDGWLKTGERIYNLEKIFNWGAGFRATDDTLPKRMLEEPFTKGFSKGHVCKLDEMLPDYYELRGWDKEGNPTDAKLKELNLYDLVKSLEWY